MNSEKPYKHGVFPRNVPFHLMSNLTILLDNLSCQQNFQRIAFRFFREQRNPLSYAASLMLSTKGLAKGQSLSFSRSIMEALKKWCSLNDLSKFFTREQKAEALDKVLQLGTGSLVGLVCEVYRIKEDSEYFQKIVQKLLREQKFKEAYYVIIALDLERCIPLIQFAFPIFILDKDAWLKEVLNKHRDLQLTFLKTLDSVCRTGADIQDFIGSFPVQLSVKGHTFEPNRFQKRLANLVEYFEFDMREFPNLFHIRSGNAVNYLLRKRFTENSMGMEAWEELTKVIVADSPLLQKELLIKLVCFNETSLALKLARDFGLREENWPDVLHINAPSPSEDTNSNELKDSTDNTQSFLTLRLLHSDIHIVDTKDTFLQAIADISENYDTVGIDAEWRPSLGINAEKLSLLQLAVWDSAYLMDILKLQECLEQCHWEQMMDRIFCSRDILKLGYGVESDLQKLRKLFQVGKAQDKPFTRLVDLSSFCKKASSLYPQAFADFSMSEKSEENDFDDPCAVESKGLSQLCYNILGKPLNKNEQFSDWEKRPLRLGQRVYAALDAYCLLLIYEKLFHAFQREHLSFDEVLESCSSHVPKKKVGKKKKPEEVVHPPRPVSAFRVVADNMAQGVGRYLRIFGADVLFLTNDDDHMQAVKIAQAEDRVILTSGRAYEKLRGYMPEGMCFSVPNEVNAKQQAAIVLKHFNIQCNESDLFSRCSVCNGNEYQSIASDELHSMRSGSSDHESYGGAPIQLSALSEQVFERVKTFLVCVNCGKVYWEGSHYTRTKEHLSELINLGEGSRGNIYEVLEESKCDKDAPVCNSPEEKETKDEAEIRHSSSARTIMHFEEYSSEDSIDDIMFC